VKRVVEEAHPPDSPEYILAAAVRATPRVEPERFEVQRILARVRSAAQPRRAVTVRLLVATAIALFAVAAAAAVSVRAHRTSASNPVTATVPPRPAPAPAPPPATATLPEPAASVEAPDPSPSASVSLSSTRVTASPRTGTPPRGGEDPTLVLASIKALRQNGDPARASALLSQYLREHPRGVLSEDALALSIEAANALHDSRSAAILGRQYLAQFSTGRYRAFALQATQSPAR